METRKVQMTGGSSLMITLPKDWTASAGVRKNDPLYLETQQDGSLMIYPASKDLQVQRAKLIDADGVKDAEMLYRMLVGSYMAGYDTIEVTSSGRISDTVRNTVERMTQTAIGIEIVEEFDRRMILKDLVDPSEMRMARTMERMRSLVSNMLSDVMASVASGPRGQLDNVIYRDSDVDRLEWLVTRQTNMAHRDPAVCRKMGIGTGEMVSYYIICRIIERIGDHVVTIAKNMGTLMDSGPSDVFREEIVSIGEQVNRLFGASVDAWARRDIGTADGSIRDGERLADMCNNINRHAMLSTFGPALSASLIAGSLRRICEYSMDISEHAINTAM